MRRILERDLVCFLGSTFGVFGVLLLRALTMFGADVVVNSGNAYVS